ncbi:ABC transporter permease [Kineococcus sp. SYSU DK006]|uniref:PH-like domain-containing protein n=1 Tax=Kineococcus sp. SYSU DK006 TaxID=3383127 RepID=UPI003D7EE754
MRVLAVVLLVLVLLLLWRMMFMGYRGRALRQRQELPRPIGSRDWKAMREAVEGVYVSTTDAENSLDRIAAHGLGTRSAVAVGFLPEGIGFLREGARSFVVPLADVVGVGHGPGMVGKWMGRGDGLLVLRWKLGGRVVDTGVKPRRAADGPRFAAQVEDLLRERRRAVENDKDNPNDPGGER